MFINHYFDVVYNNNFYCNDGETHLRQIAPILLSSIFNIAKIDIGNYNYSPLYLKSPTERGKKLLDKRAEQNVTSP